MQKRKKRVRSLRLKLAFLACVNAGVALVTTCMVCSTPLLGAAHRCPGGHGPPLALGFLCKEVLAQQTVHDQAGSPFMEELPDGKPASTAAAAAQQKTEKSGQLIRQEDGSTFMEEVPEKKKTRPARRPEIDFSNLGVPVDPSGRIIPLIQPGGGPVMPNFSRMEIDYTPPTVYVPYTTYTPYGYLPRYTPFGTYALPVYRAQQNGILAVPLGIPRTYASSSAAPAGSQETNFQFSGSYTNGTPAASIWSPAWRSPWGGGLWLPQVTQFEQKGTIRSYFPPDLNP